MTSQLPIRPGPAAFNGRRVLLLQGPYGMFFRRLAEDLRRAGAWVQKVDFNGGDHFVAQKGNIKFQQPMEQWSEFLRQVIRERRIDCIILFGDCRPIHAQATEVAAEEDIDVAVLEEGYLRPDFITFEWHGVNGRSRMPRDPEFYRALPDRSEEEVRPVGKSFHFAIWWAIMYYLGGAIYKHLFRHYVHHRTLRFREGVPFVKSFYRKYLYRILESGKQRQLVEKLDKRYFIVPLQVFDDSQIRVHSKYDSMHSFIEEVATSFAKHADADKHLVFKHHPMDRGYNNFNVHIKEIATTNGIADRTHYIHDQHLPTLLRHCCGTIMVNSTVGFSALHHGVPVKVCGDAIFDFEGLTFQGTLDEFWQAAPMFTIDRDLYEKYRSYLIAHSQWNGNFFKRVDPAHATGVVWQSYTIPPDIAATK